MADGRIIPGLKLIRHNANRIDLPDDPSYPYRLEINCRPPEFMAIAFIGLYGGSEEVVIRSKTASAIGEFLDRNDMRSMHRLRWIKIEGPAGPELDALLATVPENRRPPQPVGR